MWREYILCTDWSDAENLWRWLHFTKNGNGRSWSAARDLKAIWCRYTTPELLAEHGITASLIISAVYLITRSQEYGFAVWKSSLDISWKIFCSEKVIRSLRAKQYYVICVRRLVSLQHISDQQRFSIKQLFCFVKLWSSAVGKYAADLWIPHCVQDYMWCGRIWLNLL